MNEISTWIWEQVDNVTQLYPVTVAETFTPKSIEEVQEYIQTLLQDKVFIGNNDILLQGGAIALLGQRALVRPLR